MWHSYTSDKLVIKYSEEASKEKSIQKRQSWHSFQKKLSDRKVWTYFRMSRECFQFLCNQIKLNVGQSKFKSKQYLQELRWGTITDQKSQKWTMPMSSLLVNLFLVKLNELLHYNFWLAVLTWILLCCTKLEWYKHMKYYMPLYVIRLTMTS